MDNVEPSTNHDINMIRRSANSAPHLTGSCIFQLRKSWSPLPLVLGGALAMHTTNYAAAGNAAVSPFVITASDVAAPSSQPFQITQDDVRTEASGRTLTYGGAESAGTAAITNNEGDRVNFTQQSTAAQATIVNNSGGSTQFSDQSSAGSAFFTNNTGSSLGFSGQSSAEGANITNNQDGTISFADQSKGGSAAIANNGVVNFVGDSDAQQVNLTNNGGATVTFSDQSHAGTAQLTNNGTIWFQDDASAEGSLTINNGSGFVRFGGNSTAGTSAITNSGIVSFDDNATAGSASLINNKTGNVSFSGSSSAGAMFIANSGQVEFTGQSSSGTAEIINNATGTLLVSGDATLANSKVNNGGRAIFSGNGSAGAASIVTGPDGVTLFTQSSNGGTAALQTDIGGVADISGVTNGGIFVGSIAGAGTYYLGGVMLTVGGNGLSTTVDGEIADGGVFGGTGGSLTKVGAGTLTLSGVDSYTGATFVRGGVLQAGAAGSFAHGSDFDVDAGAMLDLAGFDQQIGSLAGTGSVDLAAATLTLGRDGHDSMFSGQIGGTGGLLKTGDGLFELAGTSFYSGATILQAGELRVSGSIADSAIDVEHGAVLSGNGTVGSIYVGGTFSRRDGGTMTVNGGVTFAAGGTYAVVVSATPAPDLLNVLGTATLGGSLAVTPVGNFSLQGTTIRILSASQVDGTFALVNAAMPFIDLSVIYNSGSVDLEISRSSRDFAASAGTPNEAAVAQALDALGSGSVYVAVVNSPSDFAARSAFDALSGEIYTSIPMAAVENDLRLQGMLAERANAQLKRADSTPAFWTQPYFAGSRYGSDGNAATVENSSRGMLGGFDAAVGDHAYIGLASAVGRGHVSVSDRYSSADITTLSLSSYLASNYSGWRAMIGGLASWHQIDADRTISFSGFEDRTEASYHAASGEIFGELGYPFAIGAVEWTPFVDLSYAWWRGSGFQEQGGDASLSVHRSSDDGIITRAGLRLASELPLDGINILRIGGLLGWRYASFRNGGGWASLDGSAPFFIGGVPLERNAGLLEVNADIVSGRISMGLTYEGLFGGGTDTHSVRGVVKVGF
jgi:autotransporter-associated beta strand protein